MRQDSKVKEQQRKATRITELPANGIESMHFAYKVKGGDDVMRPVRVFDDGKKTFIEFPSTMAIGPCRKSAEE